MRFTDRKEFEYDPELFGLGDTQTALKINAEYTRVNSPRPAPKFFEVDRQSSKYDPLWHVSLDERTVFSRVFEMPCLVRAQKPDWRLTKIGIVPKQKLHITMSNLILQEFDYFPERGDLLYYNGYRHMIINVILDPQAVWQMTNVWLALLCETVIPAEGDARPVLDPGNPVPRELTPQTRTAPYV